MASKKSKEEAETAKEELEVALQLAEQSKEEAHKLKAEAEHAKEVAEIRANQLYGIEIDEVSDTTILGKSWDAPNEQHVQFSVDLTDGSHKGGSSPPDYPTS